MRIDKTPDDISSSGAIAPKGEKTEENLGSIKLPTASDLPGTTGEKTDISQVMKNVEELRGMELPKALNNVHKMVMENKSLYVSVKGEDSSAAISSMIRKAGE